MGLVFVRQMGHLIRLVEHWLQVHICPQLGNTVSQACSRHITHVLPPSPAASGSAASAWPLPLGLPASLAAARLSSTLLTRSLAHTPQRTQPMERQCRQMYAAKADCADPDCMHCSWSAGLAGSRNIHYHVRHATVVDPGIIQRVLTLTMRCAEGQTGGHKW